MDKPFDNLENIRALSDKIGKVFNQNELLRGAINSSHEGIAILDKDGKYIYLNTAHEKMFGYDPGELIGQKWEVLYKSPDILFFHSNVFPMLEKNGKWSGKYRGYAKDGSPVYEELYLTALPSGGLVCTCRIDICGTCDLKIDGQDK